MVLFKKMNSGEDKMDIKKIMAYSRALSENNDRQWFHQHHGEYEAAQNDFLSLLDIMKFPIMQYAPSLGDQIMFTPPKLFMYRIPRDMRYSRGKTPYNPAFRAYFSPNKKEFLPLSYFFRISGDQCSIGTGVYPWDRELLGRLRDYIMYNYEELDDIVAENDLEVEGEALKRAPKGYDENHPAISWLRYKYITVRYEFTPEEIVDEGALLDAAGQAIRRFEPLREYLSGAYEGIPFDIY